MRNIKVIHILVTSNVTVLRNSFWGNQHNLIIILFIQSLISNVYNDTSSMDLLRLNKSIYLI